MERESDQTLQWERRESEKLDFLEGGDVLAPAPRWPPAKLLSVFNKCNVGYVTDNNEGRLGSAGNDAKTSPSEKKRSYET